MSENSEYFSVISSIVKISRISLPNTRDRGSIMLEQNKEALYAAFESKDARFDGRFYVGIKSTGIYCRPTCYARMPKYDNCTFFETAAEAEQAGYRPCLLCRPELAPGYAPVDASASLARRAAKYMEQNCGRDERMGELAARLGCTDRHLRRVFEQEYHVKPIEYMGTCRLLLAKSLLTDTDLSVLDVSMASGFHSLRRFHDVFREKYKMTPTKLRKGIRKDSVKNDSITLALGYRPPYRWDKMLEFLALRAIPGVEKVEGDIYKRTVHLVSSENVHIYGWICVKNDECRDRLSVTLSSSLIPILPAVLGRVKNLFDLYCEPDVVENTLKSMDEIIPGLFIPGIRIPGCFDPFEMGVRAVLGQQITVKAAATLAGRLAGQFGQPVETGIQGLNAAFPSPETILALKGPVENHLGPVGVIAARARTIQLYAGIVSEKKIDFECCADPLKAMDTLMSLPGIGPWTANYIAMRALGFTDGFPATDLGIKKVLLPRDTKEILALAENWRPWRAYAAMCIWSQGA